MPIWLVNLPLKLRLKFSLSPPKDSLLVIFMHAEQKKKYGFGNYFRKVPARMVHVKSGDSAQNELYYIFN